MKSKMIKFCDKCMELIHPHHSLCVVVEMQYFNSLSGLESGKKYFDEIAG